MSTSVGASSGNNPYAYLQTIMQQEQSQSSSNTQTDPLSQLFTAMDQQGSGASSSSGASTVGGPTSGSGSVFKQFGAQTLQALLALQQTTGADSSASSLLPQTSAEGSTGADGSTGGDGTNAGQQAGQAQQGQHGHHHHHMGGMSGPGGTANGDGSTTLTYADGSSAGTTTSGGSNVASNNLIEQLIQMQAQLLNPATTSLATA